MSSVRSDTKFQQLLIDAQKGEIAAQFELARLYEIGEEVVRDDTQAAIWYHKAAEQGHVEAQFNLAWLYLESSSIERDNDAQALKWFELAARSGHAEAQHKLGNISLCFLWC